MTVVSFAGIMAAALDGAAGFFAAAALPAAGRAGVALRERAAGAAGAAAVARSLGFAAGALRCAGFAGDAARDAAGFLVAFFAAFLRPPAAALVLSVAGGPVRLPAGRDR